MDWGLIGGGIVSLISGGYAALKRAKAKRAEEAVKAVEDAAIEAIDREIDDMMETFRKSMETLGGSKSAGAALLAELEIKRKRAIERGREAAIRTHREKMRR